MTAKETRAAGAAEALAALPDELETAELAIPLAEELEKTGQLLSDKEIAEIKAEARKQFENRQKKQARARLIDEELSKLERQRGGVVFGDERDDLLSVTLDLEENADRVIIDGEIFFNGQVVTRPRWFINSLLEMMWRGRVAQHNLDGKKREDFYRRQQPVVVTKSTAAVDATEMVRVS